MRKAAEWAVEQINNSGGIQALGGARLELLVEDGQGTAEQSVTAFERLIQRDVAIVMGTQQSTTALAVGQQADRVEVPFIVDNAQADTLVRSDLKFLVRLAPGAAEDGEAALGSLDVIEEAQGEPIERIVWTGLDETVYVDDVIAAGQEFAPTVGREVVHVVRFTGGQPSYDSEIASIRDADPDAVISCAFTPEDALSLVRAYRQQGLGQIPLINCSVAFNDPNFVEAAGNLKEGLYMTQGWSANLPGAQTDFWAAFEDATGGEVDFLSGLEVQSVYVVKAAIEECECTDRKGINDALHSLVVEPDSPNFVLQPGDGIEFDASGRNLRTVNAVYQWQGEAHLPIWPDDVAQATPKPLE